MRFGFTTGSCAAAAAKAATYMLLFGVEKDSISIITPKGPVYTPEVLQISRGEDFVRCAVQKDGGDDPDITSGMLIFATVKAQPMEVFCRWCENVNPEKICAIEQATKTAEGSNLQPLVVVDIDGGEGVGRVTKPGLDQPVGAAAINHVPREMITEAVREVCELVDFRGRIYVEISVPGGEELAARTFNPKLGIMGGISIIGTSGIVEPMSHQALLDTIRVELRQRKALGYDYVAVTPGNYGRDFMNRAYGYDLNLAVKCSNFIGATIDMAAEEGLTGVLLTGHIGKLAKVAGGMMNTHSKEGDCRMEQLSFAAKEVLEELAAKHQELLETEAEAWDGPNIGILTPRIMDCVVTEEALRILAESDILPQTMERIMERIMGHLRNRADGKLEIDCIMYSNDFGELAKSEGANKWLILLAQEQAQLT